MSSSPLPVGTLLIRAGWGNRDSWGFQWKPLAQDWTQQLKLARLGLACHPVHTCVCTHTRTHTGGFHSFALPKCVSGAESTQSAQRPGVIICPGGGEGWGCGPLPRSPSPALQTSCTGGCSGGSGGQREGAAPSCQRDSEPTPARFCQDESRSTSQA